MFVRDEEIQTPNKSELCGFWEKLKTNELITYWENVKLILLEDSIFVFGGQNKEIFNDLYILHNMK